MTVDYEPWKTCWIKAQSYTTTRNLILGGSAGKLRERGTTVAWDPWQDQDALLLGLEELTLSVERSLTDSSLGHTKEGRGRTPRSRSSWGLVTKCGHYSRNSQDLWDGKDILLCLCMD